MKQPLEGRNLANESPNVGPYVVGHQFAKNYQFTPDLVREFSRLAGDTNQLHHDELVASSSRFGQLIASGTHSSAILFGLTAEHYSQYGSVVGLHFDITFSQAVPATALARLEWTVTTVTPTGRNSAQVLDLVGRLTLEDGTVCVRSNGRLLVGFQ
ncbi:MaoC family dehydratase [uncultured Hydrogenophaga sp.]|uniref:MaoC family dehydratase n=1 Tax=uncultured Hydrogenophaga sp. TaxID=199683 RepID=UPI00258456E9|nr:MaoC family dehydratase [uncultured Hydrogenophaga sp.]